MSVTVPVCPREAVVTGNDRLAVRITDDTFTWVSNMAAFDSHAAGDRAALPTQAFMTLARVRNPESRRDRDALDRHPGVKVPLSQPNATGTLFPGAGLRMMVRDIDGTASSQVGTDKDV